jgi:signal transduction histidine kinase
MSERHLPDPSEKGGAKTALQQQVEKPDSKIKKWLKIEIEDTGIGIKESDLDKLFKYFSMLKDDHKINTKGTGLGLNITKRIVESMGG